MFDEVQREMLVRARKSIAEGSNRFICTAITEAVHATGLGGDTYEGRFPRGAFLKEQIEFGIDHYSCVEIWLFSETGIYPNDVSQATHDIWNKIAFKGWVTSMPRKSFEELCRQARLAWIDRALDRGTLV